MSGDFMQGNADNAISVPFSDDESELKPEQLTEDEDDKPSASPEERITRKAKRQERIKRLLDEGKKNGEEVKTLKGELEALKAETLRLQGFVAAQAQRPPEKTDGKDEYDRELDAIYEKQANAYNAAQAEIKAGTFDEKRSKYYEQVAREIETAKTRVHTRRELAQQEPARRAEQGQQRWVNQYPDVYRDPQAYQYAEATFRRKQALLPQGSPVTEDMVHEVMRETMTTFKLGPKQAPSASEKSRLSGLPSSGSGGGSRSDGAGIQMTPELRRMAIAAYGDLPEAEAIKKWANGPGKRLRERKVL